MEFSKKIVCLVIAMNVLFTGAIMFLFWHTSSEPSALVGGWFAFTSTELWSLSKIKRDKMRGDDSND